MHTILAALGVALVAAMLVVPHVRARWFLSPDAIEHLSIAQQWVSGTGFVNGVRSYFYLDRHIPIPGPAVRAPGISVVLAVPMVAGATLSGVFVFHSLIASIMAGVGVFAARKVMPLAGALAAVLLLALSPAWLNLSRYPWSEALSLGLFSLILCTSRGVLRTSRAAAVCSLVCVAAWLVRPQLAAMTVAVGVAVVWELGPRAAIRHRPLGVFVLVFILSQVLVKKSIYLSTGLSPYQGYGMMTQIFGSKDLFYYQKEFLGTAAFLEANGERVWQVISGRPAELATTLFEDDRFHWVGWLGLPGAIYCLFRSGSASFERRIFALATFGFALIVLLTFAAYDPKRYPLIVAAAGWVCAVAMLSDGLHYLMSRPTVSQPMRRLLASAPVVLALLGIAFTTLPTTLQARSKAIAAYQQRGTAEKYRAQDSLLRSFCRHMEPDAPVAVSRNLMWATHFWCGNPGVNLPFDLSSEDIQSRFLSEENVAYVIAQNGKRPFRWLATSSLVTKVRSAGGYTLYRVLAPVPLASGWQPAPAVACIGRDDACTRTP